LLNSSNEWILGGTSTQAQDQSSQRQGKFHRHQPGRVFSPNAFKVQYLGVDGALQQIAGLWSTVTAAGKPVA
jgi:hypothetical protein